MLTKRAGGARAAVIAATVGTLTLLLLPVARSADTPEPILDSYQATGVASGVRFSFTFTNSIFERLVDLVLPYATSDLRSEGGGQQRAEAAQLYPGDLVAGGAGESGVSAFPGYTIASAPQPGGKTEDVEEEQTPNDENVRSLLGFFPIPQPPPIPPLPESALLRAQAGHNSVAARPDESSSEAVAERIVIGPMDGPHLTIASLRTFSRGLLKGVKTTQQTETEAKDIALVVSEAVTVRIRSLASQVLTSSDGVSGSVERASFTVSGVEVDMDGTTYEAKLDNTGIHLVGLPEEAPGFTPVSLDPELQNTLFEQGIKLSLGTVSPIVDGAVADASVGGLLIQFTGSVPVVPVPPIVAELQDALEDAILPLLPDDVRALYERPICLGEDVISRLPPGTLERLPPDLVNNIRPLFALCAARQALPGPGSGGATTLSIGAVQGVAVTGVSLPFDGGVGPTDGLVDGGFTEGPTDGGFTDGGLTDGGITNGGNGGASVPPAPVPLFGLVARMPSGALAGAGAGFLVLAVAFAFGPSLRPWRRTT